MSKLRALSSLTVLSLAALTVGGLAADAFALPLRIVDCNGTTRGVQEAPSEAGSRVEIDVKTPQGSVPKGTEVTLTNQTTGQVLNGQVLSDSVVVFEKVPPGNWVIGSKTGNLLFSYVKIGESISALAAYGAAAGAVVAGGGVIGGTVGIVNSVTDGDSKKSPPPPVPTSRPTPAPTEPPCPDCDPDAPAPPIDDFFNSHKLAQQSDMHQIDSFKARQAADGYITTLGSPLSPSR